MFILCRDYPAYMLTAMALAPFLTLSLSDAATRLACIVNCTHRGVRLKNLNAHEYGRRYLLGESGRSHIVGFGKNPPVHVQNMPASCVAEPTPCNFVNGFLTPSANPNVLYGALVQV